MNRIYRLSIAAVLLVVLAGGVAVSCEYAFDPLEEEIGLYSIYGYLDLNADSSYIRVKDLKKPLTASATRDIDYSVTLENLDTGDMEVLEDSIVGFAQFYAHNFRTTMEILPAARYRIRVEGPGGKSASATTTTPERAVREVAPVGQPCDTPIRLSFYPVGDPADLAVEAGYEDGGIQWVNINQWRTSSSEEVVFTFTPNNLLGVAGIVFSCDAYFESNLIYVRYTHYSPDFYDRVDSDTLGIPGGIGRFGALYRESFTFPVDATGS